MTYEERRQKNNAETARRRREVSEYIRATKEGKPCADCGVAYPFYVMDYDHIEGMKKECNLAAASSIFRAKQEIAKCELVCSNCHRERTYNRFWSRNSL
jgi:hypothetical protein